jgi:hypothetical protein
MILCTIAPILFDRLVFINKANLCRLVCYNNLRVISAQLEIFWVRDTESRKLFVNHNKTKVNSPVANLQVNFNTILFLLLTFNIFIVADKATTMI